MVKNKEYRLLEVNSSELKKEFLEFPKRLYEKDPYWVAPLDNSIKNVFSRTKNLMFQGGDAIRWIVKDTAGLTVGRIAAFYNEKAAAIEEQPTGGCGFFEAIDNKDVAFILFDAAKEWLMGKGMEAMDGPINFGTRDSWWGLLVDGFDSEPPYENTYNFPYYQKLFEDYGFQNYFGQNTYLFRIGTEEVNPAVIKRAERLLSDPAYSVKNIRGRILSEVAEEFRTVYNRAWTNFSGVDHMSKEEATKIVNSLKPILDRDIVLFAYYEERPIGFFIIIPDINNATKTFNGRFGLCQKLELLYQARFGKKCSKMRGLVFGVDPEFQFKGVESTMIKHLRDDYVFTPKNKRYTDLEIAWIGDFNPVMNKMIIKYVGAHIHRQHTTYRYLFDRTKEFKRCPPLEIKRNS